MKKQNILERMIKNALREGVSVHDRGISNPYLKKFLFEGHDVQWGSSADSKDDIMKKAQEELKSYDIPNGISDIIWIGNVTEDQMYDMVRKYENKYIVVGNVDGEFTYAYGYRS